jgi:hypothetical protein
MGFTHEYLYKEVIFMIKQAAAKVISYRLKCVKTANGLTHFVFYGDVPKEDMPL